MRTASVLSRWISADPALGKYLPNLLNKNQLDENWDSETDLPGHGGIFRSANLNLFTYTHDNPVVFVDPDGNSTIFIDITRKVFTGQSTIGTMTVNSSPFGVTLELPYRGNKSNVSSIPSGTHFAHFYSSKDHPRTIEIIVQGRRYVLVHNGIIPDHTKGCILLATCVPRGKKDMIQDSKVAYKKFQEFLGVPESLNSNAQRWYPTNAMGHRWWPRS